MSYRKLKHSSCFQGSYIRNEDEAIEWMWDYNNESNLDFAFAPFLFQSFRQPFPPLLKEEDIIVLKEYIVVVKEDLIGYIADILLR
jgi:hypothetical protein